MSESKSTTSNLVLRSSIAGMNEPRWIPFKYSSSGCRLFHISGVRFAVLRPSTHLEVITQTTPNPINRSSSPRRSMAVTMSVTCAAQHQLEIHAPRWTHLKLIKTEHSPLCRQTSRYLWQRISLAHSHRLVPLRDLMLPPLDLQHEAVKVYSCSTIPIRYQSTALAFHRQVDSLPVRPKLRR